MYSIVPYFQYCPNAQLNSHSHYFPTYFAATLGCVRSLFAAISTTTTSSPWSVWESQEHATTHTHTVQFDAILSHHPLLTSQNEVRVLLKKLNLDLPENDMRRLFYEVCVLGNV